MRNVFSIVLLAMVGLSCKNGCNTEETCDSSASLIDVEGIWTIEGEGERAGCQDERLNGEFDLGPSIKLSVESDHVTTRIDASVSRDSGSRDGLKRDGIATDGIARDGIARYGIARDGISQSDLRASDLMTDELLARDLSTHDMSAQDFGGASDGPSDSLDVNLKDGSKDVSLFGDASSDVFTWDGTTDGVKGAPHDGAKDLKKLSDSIDSGKKRDARVPSNPTLTVQKLHLSGPVHNFSFSGEAAGNCASFETVEDTLNDGKISYSFSGKISSDGRSIEGRFSGSGPGGCRMAGDFEVTIR
jgi:hypothetical protein